MGGGGGDVRGVGGLVEGVEGSNNNNADFVFKRPTLRLKALSNTNRE